jgi:hypothetical protein
MCRIRVENLFHNCGQVERITTPSVNRECTVELKTVNYHGNRFCARCIWGNSVHKFHNFDGLGFPCDSYKSLVTVFIYQNDEKFHSTSKEQLWAKRKELLERWMTWQREQLCGAYISLRAREVSSGIPVREQTYYLGPGSMDKNFLTRIKSENVPEAKEDCFCGFSVKVRGEGGCEGGGPCSLPCGHIFGYGCVARWVEKHGSSRCPTCSFYIKIFRNNAEYPYPRGYMDHYAYDNDTDGWKDKLRQLSALLAIYFIALLLLMLLPPPPWTSWRTVCLVTVWIPYGKPYCHNDLPFLFHEDREPRSYFSGSCD